MSTKKIDSEVCIYYINSVTKVSFSDAYRLNNTLSIIRKYLDASILTYYIAVSREEMLRSYLMHHCVCSRTTFTILVDHFKLCFWQLGINAGYVSQIAEAVLWSYNHLELSDFIYLFFQTGSLVVLLWEFNMFFITCSQVRWITVAGFFFPLSLPWCLRIIIKHCCTLLCFWCQLGRVLKSKAVLSAINQQRQNKHLTQSCQKWSGGRLLGSDIWSFITIKCDQVTLAFCHVCLVHAVAALQTTRQLRSRALYLIAGATPLILCKCFSTNHLTSFSETWFSWCWF